MSVAKCIKRFFDDRLDAVRWERFRGPAKFLIAPNTRSYKSLSLQNNALDEFIHLLGIDSAIWILFCDDKDALV
jgi:hypothetical protein